MHRPPSRFVGATSRTRPRERPPCVGPPGSAARPGNTLYTPSLGAMPTDQARPHSGGVLVELTSPRRARAHSVRTLPIHAL